MQRKCVFSFASFQLGWFAWVWKFITKLQSHPHNSIGFLLKKNTFHPTPPRFDKFNPSSTSTLKWKMKLALNRKKTLVLDGSLFGKAKKEPAGKGVGYIYIMGNPWPRVLKKKFQETDLEPWPTVLKNHVELVFDSWSSHACIPKNYSHFAITKFH